MHMEEWGIAKYLKSLEGLLCAKGGSHVRGEACETIALYYKNVLPYIGTIANRHCSTKSNPSSGVMFNMYCNIIQLLYLLGPKPW